MLERTSPLVTTVKSAPARILVVEDQDDVRRLLVTALEMDGHHVEEAATASEGLTRLERSRYDLVLSDYAMPGGTGTWMLHEAQRRGFLEDAEALIITAHPDIRELADVEVISKPLDLDRFLEQVRKLLERHRSHASREPYTMEQPAHPNHHKVELVLYVSSASPSSFKAMRNLDRLLSKFERAQVKVTVRDLVREPHAGDDDRIAFTPTLVKRYPEPRVWVVGNLRDSEVLEDLLRVCGVDGS